MTWRQMFGPAGEEQQRRTAASNILRPQEALRASVELEAMRRQKLSEVAKRRKLGQYRKGSGRGRKGWHRGFWCDSSYELAFVMYALDQGMAFERNCQKFAYTFGGKSRTWIPDFRLTDGTYLEIKGYRSEQAEAKFAAFPYGLTVVDGRQMGFVFEYVTQTYGKNFTDLYE